MLWYYNINEFDYSKNTSGGFGTGADLTINGETNGRGSGNISTNVADGYQALQNNTTGKENVAIGYQSLQNNTTGEYNIACGAFALQNCTTGVGSTAVGKNALGRLTTGGNNIAIGGSSSALNSVSSNNVGVGVRALCYCLGGDNTGIGYNSQFGTTSTSDLAIKNTSVGSESLTSNLSGQLNTAIGYKAYYNGTVYNNSTALGASTVITGNQAVAIGYLATASDNQIVLGTANETVLCKGTSATYGA